MRTKLKESYFVGDSGAMFYIGQDREIHKEDVINLLRLYGADKSEFERIINGIRAGYIGVCAPGEYLCVDVGAEEMSEFRHIPTVAFKRLIKDPDTIRLRHKPDNVILLQYNPEAITV